MKDKKLQKGIQELKNITMTPGEKNRIFESILKTAPQTKPIHSPWFGYSFIFMMKQSRLAYFVLVPLIFILTGGGVVFASQDSLPNSILYPLKVAILEPIGGVLSFSPKAKAEHESKLASSRLIEAETLASQNKLNTRNETRINNLLSSHTSALNKALDKADELNKNEDTEEIITNFRAEMNAHARVLDIINQEEDTNKGIKISENARLISENMKDRKKNKDSKNKYIERKEEVKLLIEKTGESLKAGYTDETEIRKSTDEVLTETLNDAKNYLDEAEKKELEGNSEEAYSSLLDSKSSIREVEIFLKTRLDSRERSDSERETDDNNKD